MDNPTLKEWIDELMARHEIYDIEDFTCYDCRMWRKCPDCFDIYNLDGKCLLNRE